jgi:hypothetical protein
VQFGGIAHYGKKPSLLDLKTSPQDVGTSLPSPFTPIYLNAGRVYHQIFYFTAQ